MHEIQSAWPAGIKKTRQRVCVLSVLERSDRPLSAMDICRLTEEEDSVWLSTVYRVLELFVKENMAVVSAMPDGGTALYELNRHRNRHYAVCLACHKVLEVDECPMEKHKPELSESDFRILGHRLEMYGYCGDCDVKKRPPDGDGAM